MNESHNHFSKIAREYEGLRTTDQEPIWLIERRLQNLKKIEAADIGCGTGRYDVELFRHLGDRLNLIGVDCSEDMLNELAHGLRDENFETIKALAEKLPLEDGSLDAVFTFNAVHHFALSYFLPEASRVLRKDGFLFIYTRLRIQNRRSVWGRFFPDFYEKERRLYELYELNGMNGALGKAPGLELESVEYFKYRRTASLDRLVAQAKGRHYSTFDLYGEEEFADSLERFKENVARHYKNTDRISWDDENVMLVVEKKC